MYSLKLNLNVPKGSNLAIGNAKMHSMASFIHEKTHLFSNLVRDNEHVSAGLKEPLKWLLFICFSSNLRVFLQCNALKYGLVFSFLSLLYHVDTYLLLIYGFDKVCIFVTEYFVFQLFSSCMSRLAAT